MVLAELRRRWRAWGGPWLLGGLVVGRAALLPVLGPGALLPLGPAYWLVLQRFGLARPLPAAAALVSGALWVAPERALRLALALAVAGGLLALLQLAGRRVGLPITALAAAAAAAAGVWPLAALRSGTGLLTVQAVCEGLAAAGGTWLFAGLLSQFKGNRFALPRHGWHYGALGAVAALGLVDFSPAGLPLGNGLIMSVLLAAALQAGAAPGAAIGAGAALLHLLGSAGAGPQVMVYPLSGFLAGLALPLGRAGGAAAFLSAHLLTALFLPGSQAVAQQSLAAALALVVVWVVPRDWLQAVLPPAATDRGETERRRQLLTVLRDLQNTFGQAAAAAAETAVADVVADKVQERVCQGCSLHRTCWGVHAAGTTAMLQQLWTDLGQRGPLRVRPVSEGLQRGCNRPVDMVLALNGFFELERLKARSRRQLDECRQLVADYLAQIGRLLEQPPGPAPAGQPRLRLQTGVAAQPKKGRLVSGDAHLQMALGEDRYLLAVSDGMGAGPSAALASEAALQLLGRLLAAGLDLDLSLQTVNIALLFQSDHDTFATLDLACVDLGTGRARFVKVGAPPAFIRSADAVVPVRGQSAPVGIVRRLQPAVTSVDLQPGDLVVLLTDGVWECLHAVPDREDWFGACLGGIDACEPAEIARELLRRVGAQGGPPGGDDMTVLVAAVQRD